MFDVFNILMLQRFEDESHIGKVSMNLRDLMLLIREPLNQTYSALLGD